MRDDCFPERHNGSRDLQINFAKDLTQISQAPLYYVILIKAGEERMREARGEWRERGSGGRGGVGGRMRDLTSKCSSPAAMMTCSPVSCTSTSTLGSAWFKCFKPSTNFGISIGFVGSIATRTIGDD